MNRKYIPAVYRAVKTPHRETRAVELSQSELELLQEETVLKCIERAGGCIKNQPPALAALHAEPFLSGFILGVPAAALRRLFVAFAFGKRYNKGRRTGGFSVGANHWPRARRQDAETYPFHAGGRWMREGMEWMQKNGR